jgi:uncharacterized membrane protein YoaK (UPF0700 family)
MFETFNMTEMVNKTANMQPMDQLSYINTHQFIFSWALAFLMPILIVLLAGAINGSIIKGKFWLSYIIPLLIVEILLLLLIVVWPVIPYYLGVN